jgi:hypothetical protein
MMTAEDRETFKERLFDVYHLSIEEGQIADG